MQMAVVRALNSQSFFQLFVVPDVQSPKLSFLTASAAGKLDPTVPSVFAVKDHGRSVEYFGPVASDRVSMDYLTQWVRVHRHPLVPELDTGNHRELLSGSHLVVMLIVDPAQRTKELGYMEEVARTWNARKTPTTYGVYFVWLDGHKWASYVERVYRVKSTDLPSLVISDPGVDLYFDFPEVTPATLGAEAIESALDAVIRGVRRGKTTHGAFKHSMLVARRKVLALQAFVVARLLTLMGWLVVGGLVVVVVVRYYASRRRSDRPTPSAAVGGSSGGSYLRLNPKVE
jgi:hypothetical protein